MPNFCGLQEIGKNSAFRLRDCGFKQSKKFEEEKTMTEEKTLQPIYEIIRLKAERRKLLKKYLAEQLSNYRGFCE